MPVAPGPAVTDIINGNVGSGDVANLLIRNNMDVGVLRPFVGRDGRSYCTLFNQQTGKYENKLIGNAATLSKDAWIKLDEVNLQVQQEQLGAWTDLITRVTPLTITNGMAVPIIQHQVMSDIGPATMSMDGLRKGERDRPVSDLRGLPTPITHKDFSYSAREMAVSQNGSYPLDLTHPEMAARNVLEMVERQVLGTLSSYAYGGYNIYGYLNFPQRLTQTMIAPTTGGWTPDTTYTEVTSMVQKAVNKFFRGPFMLYFSTPWLQYLQKDFSTQYAGVTLQDRIMKIPNIMGVQTLDMLSTTTFVAVLVQMTSNVSRGVKGMPLKTVSWPTQGNMELNFKTMCIYVTQLRADFNNSTGIVHGSVA